MAITKLALNWDIDERFWSKVKFEDSVFPENGCMLWTGAKNKGGYGFFSIKRRNRYAHRWAYERYRGPIDTLQLDHLCRNRACVNPDHLEPVSIGENIRRGETGISNRSKTHCPAGHEYTVANTRFTNGSRRCRICNRLLYHQRKSNGRKEKER
jgi:hypothetical protein